MKYREIGIIKFLDWALDSQREQYAVLGKDIRLNGGSYFGLDCLCFISKRCLGKRGCANEFMNCYDAENFNFGFCDILYPS